MRLPNGHGTVYKLSGKRRKPYIARVTTGWKTYDRMTKKTLDRIPEGADPFERLPDGRMRFADKQVYFNVGYYASKTEAGVRKVPIHDKVLPFFQEWMTKNDCEYLISTPEGKHFVYRNYYDSYWKPLMNQLSFDHHPHETRHTFESLMVSAGVDDKIIRKIIGHKGLSVGEIVYMHWEVEQLIEAVNQIQV